ncbi:ankyrin repeat-containing domain protein, partial [Lentinula raphanica]
YHYFDTRDNTKLKKSYQGMLLFLMLQLGAQNQNIHPALRNLFQSSIRGLSHLKPTNIQLLDTLKEIIRDLFQQKHQVYIIIDALDECEDSHLVLDFIREMTHFSWLRIIISSRDHPPEAVACFTTFLSNHNSIKEDIAIFVKNQMHLKFKNPILETEVRNKLLEKSDGGFRYIDCQLQVINKCAISRKVEKALATLPSDLKDTYTNIIAGYNSEDDLEYIYHLIIWLLYSFEPLHKDQVGTLLSIDLESQTVASNTELVTGIETIVDSTLITVDSNNIVQFAHASVKEFLLQSQEDDHNKRVLNLNAHLAHNIMAQKCLVYLLHYDYNELKRRISSQVSFGQYAIDNWIEHSQYNEQARSSDEITIELVQKFLDTSSESFLKWKKTYNYNWPGWSQRIVSGYWIIFKDCNALHIVAFFGLYQNAQKLLNSKIYKQQDKLKAVGKNVGTPLHAAAYMGHRDVVELLLKYDADINAFSKDFRAQEIEKTAIEYAIDQGYKEIVEILLKHGAELNAQQTNLVFRRTGYHGHKEMLEFLLQCNAIKPQEHDLNVAFILAIQEGHKEMIDLLLKNNVNVNVQDAQFETVLEKAVRRNHKDIVELLLEQGAIIDTQKSQFCILFQEQAATFGHKKFIEIFLNHIDDIDTTVIGYLKNAVFNATYDGHENVIEVLLEYSRQHATANVQQELFGIALNTAATENHTNIIKLILKYGVDLKSEEEKTRTALQQAAWAGHKDTVELLLLHNANVNAQGGIFETALQAAAHGNHKAIIQLLLDYGADVNANKYFGTALHIAASRNHQDIIKLLIDHGADINAHNKYLGTPLQLAISNNHQNMAQLLIEYGADVNLNAVGELVGTPLHVAVYMGHRDVVELLLDYNADINTFCKIFGSPLQEINKTAIECAIHKGYKEMVEILLKHGAELNAQQINIAFGRTGYNGHKEMLEFLLQCNAIKPQEHDLNTAFILAAQEGHKNIVELLKNNVNVNAQNEEFETALEKAVVRNHKDIVELLLEQGATIDIQKSQFHMLLGQAANFGHIKFIEIALNHIDNIDTTVIENLKSYAFRAAFNGHEDVIEVLLGHIMQHAPANAHQELFGITLNIAAQTNQNNIIKLLLKYGADLKSEEENTQKALLQAAMFGYEDTVELLLLNNANVNAQGDDLETALQAAAYGKHKAIISLLLDHGADVNANKGYDGTALHIAAFCNNQDIIKLLIDHGADINAHDKHLRTPLQQAISYNDQDIAQLLIKYGADVSDVEMHST